MSPGFPPVPTYQLVEDGGTMLAPGRCAIGYERRVTTGRIDALPRYSRHPDAWLTAAWIAQALGSSEPPLPDHCDLALVWHGNAGYRRELVRRQRRYLGEFAATANALVAAGAMTAAERSQVVAKLRFEIVDRRACQATPLSSVPVLPEPLPR